MNITVIRADISSDATIFATWTVSSKNILSTSSELIFITITAVGDECMCSECPVAVV